MGFGGRRGRSTPRADDFHRALFRANPLPMWVYDVETLAFLDVNDAAMARYGYTRAEFLGMTIADIRPAQDVPALRANVARATDGLDQAGVWRHRTRAGEILEVQITSHTLTYAGRRAKLVLARDVSAQRAAEGEQRHRARMDRVITDLANALIDTPAEQMDAEIERGLAALAALATAEAAFVFRLTDGGTRFSLSHGWFAPGVPTDPARLRDMPMAGWPWAGTVLRRRENVVVPDVEALPTAAATDRASWEALGIRSVLALPLTEGRDLAGWVGFASYGGAVNWPPRDVDSLERFRTALSNGLHRQRTDRALREREEQYRQLVETAPIGIGVADLDGRLLTFNAAMLVPGGYTADDIHAIGNVAALYHDPAERGRVLEAFRRDGSVVDYPVRFRRKDGTPYDALLSLTPVRFEGRACIQAIAVDVSERRRAEEALRASEERLLQSQKMEAIGQLAGGVAHDFNNLLTIIQGNTALLLAQAGERGRGELEEIRAAAARAAALTRQLLAFGRRQVKQAQDVELGSVVHAAVELLRRILGEDVELHARLAPDVPTVHADPGMIEQVVMNLAVNARDAMPHGGRLNITLEGVMIGDPPARDGRARKGPAARLTVQDNGVGIPPEFLPHIFEPFFTTKETGKGSGLGLATVFGIVEQHDGWIEVESHVGRGTTFRVYLPSVARAAGAATGAGLATAARGRGETILLVEDEAPVRRLARAILERHGYRVLDAGSGPEALGVWDLAGDAVELLLTDLIMPGGMSGQDLARDLLRRRPTLKVLYTSGYSREAARDGLGGGREGAFLAKPYDLVDLVAAVRRSLDEP